MRFHALFLFSAVSSSWWRMDVQQSHETVSQVQWRTSIVCINGSDRAIMHCVQMILTLQLDSRPFSIVQFLFLAWRVCFSNAVRRIKNQADCHPVNQWDDIFTAGQLQKAVLYDKNIAKMATKLFYRWCWNTTRDIHCFRFTVVMEDNYLTGLFVLSFENSIHEKSKETLT